MKKFSLIFSCSFFLAFYSFAQQVIRGKVMDASNGTGIPGASVLVKGASTGTSTQSNGSYSISVPANATTLVVKYLGFISQEVAIDGRTEINISLMQDSESLSEVVVTALGIKRSERSLGYSTQEVKGDNLTLTKEQNVIGSLAGKIAGVQVVGSSGASMGGTQKIKIRGVNSLAGSDQPLIVVDGTPISNSNFSNGGGGASGSDGSYTGADYGNVAQDINPDDIESVNVLKGPAASALYGLRGQYGVIMITTKKGAKGPKKVDVQFSSAFSIEKVGNLMPMQNLYGAGSKQTWNTLDNGQKYVQMDYDESWGPKMDGTPVRQVFSFYPQDPTYGQETPFVPHPNNIKDFFETGNNAVNSISVSGGGENSTFRLSYTNGNINGIEPNTWLRRNNLGLNASLDVTTKLTASANINYAGNKGQRPSQGYDGGSRNFVQWFQRNIDMKRLKDYKYADGTFLHWNLDVPNSDGSLDSYQPLYWNNPYFEANENLNNDDRDRIFGDIGLTYQVLPELKLSGFVRTDSYIQNIEERSAVGGRYLSSFSTGKYQNKEMNYEFLGQYNKSWDDFSLAANIGSNIYTRKYNYLLEKTEGGLISPDFYNIAASKDRPTVTSYLLRQQIRSLYAMASFGYKNIYYLDASIRNDNTSTLPKKNNSYYYPSVSGSMVFGELLKWKPLSYGKVRLSYAIAGSNVSPYRTSFVYGIGGIYDGPLGTINTIYVPDDIKNPELKPSFAHSYEAGLDLKFLNNRLGVDFTLYKQQNKDQIIELKVSGTTGFNTTIINAGEIENKGVELTLNGSPIRSQNFSWDAAFNFAHSKNLIKKLGTDSKVYPISSNTYAGKSVFLNSYELGSYGSLIGQAYQRDPATGKILLGANNMPLYTPATHNFGTVLPQYTGGFLNTFNLWKFSIAAMIDFQKGGRFFSWSKMLAQKSGQAEETAAMNDKGHNIRDAVAEGGGIKINGVYAPGTVINGTDVSGQEASPYVEARAYYRNTLGTNVYEEYLYDASYIKLRELSIGYTFDKKMFSKLPFRSLKLAFIARNPVMIWQKAPKGLDPSELSSGSSSISWLETGGLNTVRSYGLNLNINF
ncbi:SusC/RagA family TonB-linked outer membrane protein [Pedobacter panaciterrae]|jgi:TonB-linked outer membrane protein, SusC/RagA family|uniref:SusC/RagA family TonB-linked outer membrane protein n=1 Tax=Pedobacter panaciterrae TaxID=363849 RepID=A0ABU8NPQ1_9SPHI|nr:SusC/RagA family TonB-linked outer membrane protein [Pedobacter panaciterrae]NQX54394.1 SusC/RagA family TonB-linked outer membrane protein [Pedobacter panaciterrae]